MYPRIAKVLGVSLRPGLLRCLRRTKLPRMELAERTASPGSLFRKAKLRRFQTAARTSPGRTEANYSRDVAPLFERSCLDCKSAWRPKEALSSMLWTRCATRIANRSYFVWRSICGPRCRPKASRVPTQARWKRSIAGSIAPSQPIDRFPGI